jgi:hypothetical protein
MAYLQARSGVCRSGVTYAGWTPPSITLSINGTDRTNKVVRDGNFVLTGKADGSGSPATLTFTVKSITPAAYSLGARTGTVGQATGGTCAIDGIFST